MIIPIENAFVGLFRSGQVRSLTSTVYRPLDSSMFQRLYILAPMLLVFRYQHAYIAPASFTAPVSRWIDSSRISFLSHASTANFACCYLLSLVNCTIIMGTSAAQIAPFHPIRHIGSWSHRHHPVFFGFIGRLVPR